MVEIPVARQTFTVSIFIELVCIPIATIPPPMCAQVAPPSDEVNYTYPRKNMRTYFQMVYMHRVLPYCCFLVENKPGLRGASKLRRFGLVKLIWIVHLNTSIHTHGTCAIGHIITVDTRMRYIALVLFL